MTLRSGRSKRSSLTATPRRKLRTGRSVWDDRGIPRLPFRALTESIETDVVVVGGGVTGALVADAALQSGRSVAVLDRRGPAQGSTAASTALLQFDLDQPLTLLSREIGARRAARAYWRSASAIDYLSGRIEDLGLRCRFTRRSAIYLPGNLLSSRGLAEEARKRSAIGLRSEFVDRAAVFSLTGIRASGAILSKGSGELDPVALVSGLWRSAARRGARLFSPADVVDISPSRDFVTLTTRAGHQVRARHAVLATGYEPWRLINMKGHRIVSTWAIATKRQPRSLWPGRSLIWEASNPYHYLRTTHDGRILIGGADEEFSDEESRDALIPSKTRAISARLKRLMPHVDSTAEFAWAGCFGASRTGLPSIGRVPGAPRCFAVLGYGGNGITFSAVAAQLFQRALMGISDPDQDLFAFDA